jgi:hypothetical protein
MRCGIFILALGLVGSSQVSAGELQSVYVAPGGVYIAQADVHVGNGNGYPPYAAPGAAYYGPYDTPYAPGYAPPAVSGAPAYYDGYRSVYPARRAYIDRSYIDRSYIDQTYLYAERTPPRPPAPVPYGSGAPCRFNPAYGRSGYCD